MPASLNYTSTTRCRPGSPIPATTLPRKGLIGTALRCNASRMCRFLVICVSSVAAAGVLRAESPSYLVFVSNERSGDVTVIDGATDTVVGTFPVGKRPRGIHATPDGRRVFVP